MADARGPSWAAKIVALAVTVGLALGLVEVGLRYWFPVRGVLLRTNPAWLHEYAPDTRKLYRHPAAEGGGAVLVTINHQGRRGPAAAAADVPKIVVYGDSFIAAEYSRWEDTMPAQLERALTAGGSSVQVLDAGVIGYGPDQSLLRLEADLPALAPKAIVFAIYAGNDFGDLARNKLFGLDEAGAIVRRQPTLSPDLVAAFEAEKDWPSWQVARAIKSVRERRRNRASSASSLDPASDAAGGPSGGTRFDKWLAQGQREYQDAVSGDPQVRNLLADGYDAVVSLAPQSPAAQYEVRLMRAVLARVQADAAAARVPLLLLIIPSPYDAVPDYPLQPDRHAFPEYRPETLTKTVEDIARELAIPYLNLFAPFSGADARTLFFSVGNDHWNAEGERRAAALVAQEIARQHWLR